MTNIEQLQTNITELQTQLNSIQEELNRLKISKKWKPEEDNKYYFISDSGVILDCWWTCDEADCYRVDSNNCFQTKEQAIHHLECLKTKAELRELAEELNGGVEIDWSNINQFKYGILMFENTLKQAFDTLHRTQGAIYCIDDKFFDKAIERIGEQRLIDMIKEGV